MVAVLGGAGVSTTLATVYGLPVSATHGVISGLTVPPPPQQQHQYYRARICIRRRVPAGPAEPADEALQHHGGARGQTAARLRA
jgi:hypothetical protein